ncbi:hypothetical protein EPN81_01680 [Patescibacteria group bacterium]|nr:MAG: hypothetical protein EPN81_01680 [Patescibacteria group bacterium]
MMTPREAQKIQNQQFDSMSIEERFEVVKELWDLAVALAPDKFPNSTQEVNRFRAAILGVQQELNTARGIEETLL